MEGNNFSKTLEFVKKSTTYFDSSHNHEHALEVYNLSIQILQRMHELNIIESYDYNVVMTASLLHDVCDHKYGDKSITRHQLEDFITIINEKNVNDILNIIDNISYSKEKKGLLVTLDNPYNIYRDVISDADKITALGYKGIERCKIYTQSINQTLSDEEINKLVLQHCEDKLSRLLPDNYIKTIPGKELAESLHQEILQYMCKN